MDQRTACVLVVVALGVAACTTAAADDSSTPATASSVPPASASPDATVPASTPATTPDPASSVPPASLAASDPANEPTVETGEGSISAPTSPSDGIDTDGADEGGPTSVASDAVASDPVSTDEPSIAEEVAADEPTFEVEPLTPLDLDAAVFAVDDAGIGGTVPTASEPPLTGWAAFDAALAEELIRNGNTAASVAVSIGGDIVHSAAFGWRTGDFGDPAEPGDRFRVASISKTLTSIAVLQLVEDGVIGLDDPVGGIVAESLGVAPAAGAASITVRQLLTHTSGFGKYDRVFFRKGSADCREAATIGLRSGVGGRSYRYSNMNYCVAGLLLEALTGRSYETVVYEEVLTPLGLSGMRLAPTFDPGPDEIQHYSTFGRNYMETLGAAGAWLASPDDLVTVMNSLDLSTPGWKPLEAETLAAMQTPVNGQPGQRGYGMGLILYGPGRYGHTGTIESTHAMVANRGDGVIWAITVAGPHPDSTPRLESIINRAFEAGGFIAG